MSDFKSRLQQVVFQQKSARDFAIKCNIADSLMRRYLSGESVPGLDKVLKMAEVANISAGWLASGEGLKSNDQLVKNIDHCFAEIPLVATELGAGNGRLVDDENGHDHFKFQKKWLHKKASAISNLVLMTVRGDSMLPIMDDGDMVLVDQGKTAIYSGKIYAANIGGDTLYIKRLTRVGKMIQVISDNKAVYPPFDIPPEDCRVIGQIIWCGREL